jgi:hypothetical protein
LQDYGRFHAQWRRVNPTPGWQNAAERWEDNPERMREVWQTPNTTGAANYIILDAEGRGHYVGCHLDIDCFSRQANDWYGEGDDMIFVDGAPWPGIHGTGTEITSTRLLKQGTTRLSWDHTLSGNRVGHWRGDSRTAITLRPIFLRGRSCTLNTAMPI